MLAFQLNILLASDGLLCKDKNSYLKSNYILKIFIFA